MPSIKLSKVSCKICGFTTSVSNLEGKHRIIESINFIRCTIKTKNILTLLHNHFNVNVDEVEEIFSSVMEIMGEDSKFILIDCMEITK